MNKVAIKAFAKQAREILVKSIINKAYELGITENDIKDIENVKDGFIIKNSNNPKIYSLSQMEKREALILRINDKGYKYVIDEVSYTWFNRIIALRFMEVNNYLDHGIRVLSSREKLANPDIINEALNIDLDIEKEKVYNYLDRNKIDQLYKYLLIKQCNKLGEIIPSVFEEISDYTELLLTDNLLSDNFIIKPLINSIDEEDFKEVEIIGWMYQYYISEENERVIKAKKRYKKEEIPAATQLFTPKWIVKYMVQNSLGRYWIENNPEHEVLKENWEYYLENDASLEKIKEEKREKVNIENLKCFDPAMGSGHILVYIFEVLYEIYLISGYRKRDIPRLILENNIYGLEIDDRASQLAVFALIMKAQEYNNRFLKSLEREYRKTGESLSLNICSIKETNNFTDEDISFISNNKETEVFIKQFEDAKIYGSLTEIKSFNKKYLLDRLEEIKLKKVEDFKCGTSKEKIEKTLYSLIKQADIMTSKYDITITNPPYIGKKYLNSNLKKLLTKKYKDYDTDIFAPFIIYCLEMTKDDGQLGFMTPYVWMFISSYEKLRQEIIENKDISTLVQLQYSGFKGATVPICTFTLRNKKSNIPGEYIRLSNFKGPEVQAIKTREAAKNKNVDYRYTVNSNMFKNIKSYPIAYWASEKVFSSFKDNKNLEETGKFSYGVFTCNNNRFLKYWHEVDYNNIGSNNRFVPLNKGGMSRKWFGNLDYVIDYNIDGKEIRQNRKNKGQSYSIPGENYYFKEHISWSLIGSSDTTFRYYPKGMIFDISAPSLFIDDKEREKYILSLLSTKVTSYYLELLNPTLNMTTSDIKRIPIIYSSYKKDRILSLADEAIKISKDDWNSFETSFNFTKHPLLYKRNKSNLIEVSYENWKNNTNKNFYRLKEIEEELNKIFIKIYDLEDELDYRQEEKNITICKIVDEKSVEDKKNPYIITKNQAIESFMSYIIACIMGRYSPYKDGIMCTSKDINYNQYKKFKPIKDNILIITERQYYKNDLISKVKEFLTIIFGEEYLTENLNFIANNLNISGKNKTSEEKIREYFLIRSKFYSSHVSLYKNSPIYFMFDSGKYKGFRALSYIHRYDKDLLLNMRINYLHDLEKKYESEIKHLNIILENNDDKLIEKDRNDLLQKIDECIVYDQLLANVINKNINIDLNLGIKENYNKLQNIYRNNKELIKGSKRGLLMKI